MAGKPLFNPNDGLTGRDGGPYLDEEQAREDEKRRAMAEGRKPDLEHPPANAGIALSTAAQMLDTIAVNNNPSQRGRDHYNADSIFKNAADDKDTLLTVRDEIPESFEQEVKEETERETGGDTVAFENNEPVKTGGSSSSSSSSSRSSSNTSNRGK